MGTTPFANLREEAAVNADVEVNLALLAVRLTGGRAELNSAALKTLRKAVAQARERNLLADEIDIVTGTSPKTGKPGRRKVKMVRLTEEGERHLAVGDPAALAATQTAHLAAVREALAADRETLRTRVLDALANLKPQRSEKVARALDGVAQKLAEVTALLNQRDEAPTSRLEEDLLAHIEVSFQALMDKLDRPAPSRPVDRQPIPEPALT